MWPFNGGGSGPPPLVNTLLQAIQPLVVVAVVVINVVNTAVQQQTGGQGVLAQFFQNATNFANNLITQNQGTVNQDKLDDTLGSDHESDIQDVIDGVYNPEQLPDIEDSPDFQWNFDFELEDDDNDDWLPDIGSPPPGTTWLTFEEDLNWGDRFPVEVEIDLDDRYTIALNNLVEAAPSELQLSLNGFFGEQVSVLPSTFGQLIDTEIGVNVQVTEEQYFILEQNYEVILDVQGEINESSSTVAVRGGQGTGGSDPNGWLAAYLALAAAAIANMIARGLDWAREALKALREQANAPPLPQDPLILDTPLDNGGLGETVPPDSNQDEIWNWDQGGFTLLPEERGSNIVETEFTPDGRELTDHAAEQADAIDNDRATVSLERIDQIIDNPHYKANQPDGRLVFVRQAGRGQFDIVIVERTIDEYGLEVDLVITVEGNFSLADLRGQANTREWEWDGNSP